MSKKKKIPPPQPRKPHWKVEQENGIFTIPEWEYLAYEEQTAKRKEEYGTWIARKAYGDGN